MKAKAEFEERERATRAATAESEHIRELNAMAEAVEKLGGKRLACKSLWFRCEVEDGDAAKAVQACERDVAKWNVESDERNENSRLAQKTDFWESRKCKDLTAQLDKTDKVKTSAIRTHYANHCGDDHADEGVRALSYNDVVYEIVSFRQTGRAVAATITMTRRWWMPTSSGRRRASRSILPALHRRSRSSAPTSSLSGWRQRSSGWCRVSSRSAQSRNSPGSPKKLARAHWSERWPRRSSPAARFLGMPTKRASIVMLSEERDHTLSPAIAQHAIASGGLRVLQRHRIDGTASWPQIVEASVAEMKRIGAKLLVVDTLSYWAMGDVDENSASDAIQAMEPLLKAAADLIAFASPRRGELEKLRWEDVDLARCTIRIPNGKTKGRVVPLHPLLRPWLVALHRESSPVVEPWPNDKRELARACERAGVPRVTPNDLRRSFTTWLKQSDVDSAVVAAMMGPHIDGDGGSRLRPT
ncbi:MAG: tyrosine-type recombinase/integrase [Deltaproteobacteria bacterium]|nr:tyrosine-type recombinase/integrase [Deltaproteobacteria bacterium]